MIRRSTRRWLLAVIACICLVGCDGMQERPEIFDATLARGVDAEGHALGATKSFTTSDTAINVLFSVRNSSVESFRFVVTDANRVALITLDTSLGKESNRFQYQIRTQGNFPPGSYRCEIYLDPTLPEPTAQPDQVLDFTVAAAGGARITDARLARGFDEKTMLAIDPTTTFSTADTEIHVVFNLRDTPLGSTIGVVWRDADGTELQKSETVLDQPANILSIAVASDDGLSAGRYRCELYVYPKGGRVPARPDTTIDFRVDRK